jgi:ubiquitin-conjugating enzyme E2 G2
MNMNVSYYDGTPKYVVHTKVSVAIPSSTIISRSDPPNLLSTPGCITPHKNMATSVASKRLFAEYKSLLTSPPDGITAGPIDEDDLFAWEALIQGPEGTPFEGGIFPAELKFPKDYPLNPPKMKFLGEIWHPNGMCLRISALSAELEEK